MRPTPGSKLSFSLDDPTPESNHPISLDVITFYCHPQVTKTRNIEKLPVKLNEQKMLAFFKKHDVNKDGKLSWDELKQAFRDLGVSFVSWTTDRAMLNADDNEDGYISETEMGKLIEFVRKRKLIESV